MPPECKNSCIFRVTIKLAWLKSAFIKGIITSQADKEAKETWLLYMDFVKNNGHIYKPAKSDKKLKHGIEKIQPKKEKSMSASELNEVQNKTLMLKIQDQFYKGIMQIAA